MQTATILDTLPVSRRAALLRLEPQRPVSYVAGQAVALGRHGQPERRPYSVAVGPTEALRTGVLEFLVGLGPDATPGSHLRPVTPGTLVDVEGPFGTFLFPDRPAEPDILFVAGGSGIAPLRAMLQEALALEARPRISLLYSARTPNEFAFSGELLDLEQAGRLRLLRTVTRGAGHGWTGGRGRISRADLEAVIDHPETLCYVCGPEALVHEVPRMLADIGVDGERIRVEEWVVKSRG
jgi:ferredoxin-NADP reductase